MEGDEFYIGCTPAQLNRRRLDQHVQRRLGGAIGIPATSPVVFDATYSRAQYGNPASAFTL